MHSQAVPTRSGLPALSVDLKDSLMAELRPWLSSSVKVSASPHASALLSRVASTGGPLA